MYQHLYQYGQLPQNPQQQSPYNNNQSQYMEQRSSYTGNAYQHPNQSHISSVTYEHQQQQQPQQHDRHYYPGYVQMKASGSSLQGMLPTTTQFSLQQTDNGILPQLHLPMKTPSSPSAGRQYSDYGIMRQNPPVSSSPLAAKAQTKQLGGEHHQTYSAYNSGRSINLATAQIPLQARTESTSTTAQRFTNDEFGSISSNIPDVYSNGTQPSMYNPTNISSIVHSPVVSVQELPTTLPPLNATALNAASHAPSELQLNSNNGHIGRASPSMAQQSSSWVVGGNDDGRLMRTSVAGTRPSAAPSFLNSRINNSSRREADTNADAEFSHLSPYGCGVPGCHLTFQASSGLFYHMKSAHADLSGIEKPYRCAMVNCTKRYKNINGLQYHLREAKGSSGHPSLASAHEDGLPEMGKPYKTFKCHITGCKKAYRTAKGLRNHQTRVHCLERPL